MDLTHVREVWRDADCLYNRAQVQAAMQQMAAEITAKLADTNPLCLCVMSGGVVISGHLLPLLEFPLQLDYVHASRYLGATQGGSELHWYYRPRIGLEQRTVLVMDDILDEGLTLQGVLHYCQQQGAAQVFSAVLADKQRPRAPGGVAHADFTGLSLPNRYVFGYGLDYHGYLRNADGIFAVKGM